MKLFDPPCRNTEICPPPWKSCLECEWRVCVSSTDALVTYFIWNFHSNSLLFLTVMQENKSMFFFWTKCIYATYTQANYNNASNSVVFSIPCQQANCHWLATNGRGFSRRTFSEHVPLTSRCRGDQWRHRVLAVPLHSHYCCWQLWQQKL